MCMIDTGKFLKSAKRWWFKDVTFQMCQPSSKKNNTKKDFQMYFWAREAYS